MLPRPPLTMLAAALLTLLALAAAAELKFDDNDSHLTVLSLFGDAETSFSVLYKGPTADLVVTGNDIFTTGPVVIKPTDDGYVNYTVPIIFENTVGVDDYTVTVGDVTQTGKVTLAGFVIKQGQDVVSGDAADGVTVGQSGTTEYTVQAVGLDGSNVDISGTSITAKEVSGPYMNELDMAETTIDSSKFTLAIADLRVGTGNFIITFETDAIEFNGEVFETVLRVNQATIPEPACVAIAGTYDITDGHVDIPMFNLLNPPKLVPVSTVTLSLGPDSISWDPSRSTLELPDQTVAFPVSTTGTASLTCDGAAAVVQGGEIIIVNTNPTTPSSPLPSAASPPPPPALATSIVEDLPPSDTFITFQAVIRDVTSTPALLTAAQATIILNLFCGFTGAGDSCKLSSVIAGSAIMTTKGYVSDGTQDKANADLSDAFTSCDFQTKAGYENCDDLQLMNTIITDTNLESGGSAVAGLQTWTIALIAGVGAFVLILVIVLSLWFVYRRSAEQSESDYSSSGPLGVPDPSDLLYEQSIVRDIYGRGDFPDGGPSQAVAEQRAREAALREEFPRPPSSSGVSRGNTDDASSTYSV